MSVSYRAETADMHLKLLISARKFGGLKQAEAEANASGKTLLNTKIRQEEASHKAQDERIEKVAALTEQEKK